MRRNVTLHSICVPTMARDVGMCRSRTSAFLPAGTASTPSDTSVRRIRGVLAEQRLIGHERHGSCLPVDLRSGCQRSRPAVMNSNRRDHGSNTLKLLGFICGRRLKTESEMRTEKPESPSIGPGSHSKVPTAFSWRSCLRKQLLDLSRPAPSLMPPVGNDARLPPPVAAPVLRRHLGPR
jgi:hypothetical protein